jgi:predicted anti-sigma-YlaC factor YlaD
MSNTKGNHIINLIENQPLTELSETELATVRDHSNECSACRQAFEAAQISMLLLKEGSPTVFEPSPFFQTRVMAAVRERQAGSPAWSWSRIWNATGALASSMVASVAMLVVLTFVIPGTQTTTGSLQSSSPNDGYSAEEVILSDSDLNASHLDTQTSDGQVLNALYDDDDGEK